MRVVGILPYSSSAFPTLLLLCLHLQPPRSQLQSPSFHSLQFRNQVLPVMWYPMCGLGCWPEIGDGKARFEVGAEVVHPANREHDVEPELYGVFSFV